MKLTLYVCRESKKEEDRKMICGVHLLLVWSWYCFQETYYFFRYLIIHSWIMSGLFPEQNAKNTPTQVLHQHEKYFSYHIKEKNNSIIFKIMITK